MATSRKKTRSQLPKGFAALECWLDDWVLPDSSARLDKRMRSSLDELRAFYDSMLPHADAALAYLSQRQLGELDEAAERLLKLMLSLAEVGPAIEWYGTGNYPDAFDPKRFPLIVQLSDTAPQGAHA
jgi:hypothetical protein